MFDQVKGLSSLEASELYERYGSNVLPEEKHPGEVALFLSQLKSPLVYVLIGAGIITSVLGHFSDTSIILLAVFINTVLGYIQESRAGKALSALKNLLIVEAEVIRDGERKRIRTDRLVKGDVVVLKQGTRVSADGRLIFANRLFLDEAILTGESMPVAKKEEDEVFMGTTVSAGQGLMEVVSIGSKTRMGGIASKIAQVREETPLRKQLARFSRMLVFLVLGLSFLVFVVGVVAGESPVDMFTTVVALAVSAVPEGLLVSLTVVLAVGMQRILRRRGLVRKLVSAETLGGVTTICVDKTGTLTEGKMQVVGAFGDEKEVAKQAILANDLDDPIVVAAFEWGRKLIHDLVEKHPRLDSIPFSPEERIFVCLSRWEEGNNVIFVNGAPDILVKYSTLTKEERKEILRQLDELSKSGKRLMGFARKVIPDSKNKLNIDDAKSDLSFVGILAFSDPVRPTVRDALSAALDAGIKVKVITGDYKATASYVLTELLMPPKEDEVMTGEELENMSKEGLVKKVSGIKLFARTTPEQKLLIVAALKENGEVVAMMGDGVNDAPALHKADIGIVVSEASDVARETADLVLLDSNFATIVAAVEEGRSIFENIRKIILYLLSDAFGEIVAVIGSLFLGIPLPLTAIQIIWINLVSDGFPNLALTVDPKRKEIMKEGPRGTNELLINRWMLSLICMVSISVGLMALAVFIVTLKLTGDVIYARSMSFATLGVNSLAYVFAVRSLLVPFWKNHLFENRWLILAVLVGFALQYLPFSTQSTRDFFGVKSLTLINWLVAVGLSILVFFFVELFKVINNKVSEKINEN